MFSYLRLRSALSVVQSRPARREGGGMIRIERKRLHRGWPLFVLALALSVGAPVAAAELETDAWLAGAASAREITAFYNGEGELEDAAKRSVALHTVYRYSGKAIREN